MLVCLAIRCEGKLAYAVADKRRERDSENLVHEIFIPCRSFHIFHYHAFLLNQSKGEGTRSPPSFYDWKNDARASKVGIAGGGIRSEINSNDFGLITDDSIGPPEIRAFQTRPPNFHPIETLHDNPNIKQHE